MSLYSSTTSSRLVLHLNNFLLRKLQEHLNLFMKQYLLKILYANLMKLNALTSFIMVDRHLKKNSF